ncbi:hypothetical protein ACOCEA_17865 [Maribacter sp. CXY002]
MDQLDFDFKITVIGMEITDFIDMLENNGFSYQADQVQTQFEEQMKNI